MLTEGEDKNVRVAAEEDGDMKIASGGKNPTDDGELAAEEFSRQKQNGNIEKAHALGRRFAELLFTTDELLIANAAPEYAQAPAVRNNARVLFAFMVDIVLENCCPDSVTAHTALNNFHLVVEERSAEIYHNILDSAAFSLYLLCTRDEKMACACIGDAFADGCSMENNRAVARLGDRLYNEYYRLCVAEISKVDFVR